MKRGAVLSPCGTWRYELPREWDIGNRLVVVRCLNPSTADAEKDDPTIRRVIGFAKSHGFGNLLVLNIFALRSTDPDGLRVAQDPVGPDNDAHIHDALSIPGTPALAAWGSMGDQWDPARQRAAAVLNLAPLASWFCLGTTKNGHPRHPLYIAGSTRFAPYRVERGLAAAKVQP